MAMVSIEQRVTAVIQEVLQVNTATIIPARRINNDLDADSLDQVSLVMAQQEAFNGSITDFSFLQNNYRY